MEHSAVLLTCIKVPHGFKTFVLSVFEWPLKTGFNVLCWNRIYQLEGSMINFWDVLVLLDFLIHIYIYGIIHYTYLRGHRLEFQMSCDMRFPTMWYVRTSKPQISLRIHIVWSEPLLVAWISYECSATDLISFWFYKLKRRLYRLVWVYTCQNATLLEIKYHGSNCVFLHLSIDPEVRAKFWGIPLFAKVHVCCFAVFKDLSIGNL